MCCICLFFLFKQKTAYELRISYWSSDVCSSYLFDEDICKQIEELGNDGDCGLLTVELERQPGEDMPRVTIRNIKSFSFLSNSSRLILQIDVQHASAVKAIAEILLQAKVGSCEVMLSGRLQDGKVVKVRDRKRTRLTSSNYSASRMTSSACTKKT